jgi:predicted anti-sigma-YlaC factor YlaD
MLTCKEITELNTDYLEGKLSTLQSLKFRFHLARCQHCRAFIRQMKAVIRLLAALVPEAPPEPVRDALLQEFRNWKSR